MPEFVRATILLYQEALTSTINSLKRSWLLVPAVMLLALAMLAITGVAVSLGLLGGFLLGAANAFSMGMFLALVEQAVLSTRTMVWNDIWNSAGQYFWDVITIGFMIWVPLQILELGMQANPYGPAIVSGVFLLLFLLLNPVPEILYQRHYGGSLETLKESYEFVLENWIEWFLPLAIILAPFGLTFFFSISSQGGRLIGLDFFQLLRLPFSILTSWLLYLGMSASMASILVLLLTPLGMVFMMLFRGHLFAGLHGSSRRQRLFRAKSGGI